MDIAKSVIVITAAGTPTGRALAEHFCRLNARVALVDIDSHKLQTTYESCLNAGGTCFSFFLANRSVENISYLFEEVNREMGAVDVLINYWQAGGLPSLLASQEAANGVVKDTIADVASNLYLFGRGAAFNMLDKGRKGVIVNIPGVLSNKGNLPTIDSSNAVIKGLTQSWAQELQHANIRVAGVLPRLRHSADGNVHYLPVVNYDMIDGAAYIVENDSFTGRILEAAS
ncbi:short-chain dehydrogenase [Grimontia hollisae]|uniref:Diacetyl reductase [(S)-acetoin forming] n=1 Tax=Grimontia hollisae TaxID=673 RepID=A0A377HM07_GRIHO|nr:SDR family NAD(P)-dependent oxidoreductase [Grimontia hollisae]AMG29654.1 short-chain dehydrogenase [Grimontia hollisae]MDF2186594.1 SDR family NAD(P)-dependent oxidoreductase [Grimontia hollisae]STO43702.1 Diacetyl reductase [(S)-acetoin forming] [Grimontia hollisae]STO57053.1 Diacetyl reductase [(S)-acetoin forming] [Grimontia hollisae]STQ74915.1 Diacetyl reductase [(S)-acetoin forming] [Grimontia hollisae]